MKKAILAIALVALVALGGQAFAEFCTIDQVPAATLLIPYFQVAVSTPGDGGACDDPNALTTFFTISNASAAPTLAHVTVWTDWSVPALDFDVYLTGYDVQSINVKDFFCSGNLPTTGFAVSNEGILSDPNVAYPSCNNTTTVGDPPVYPPAAIIPAFTAHLRAWFTGQASPQTGTCAGSGDQGTGIADGYITVDATQDCSVQFPAEPTYWTSGVPTTNNVLWGEYHYLDQANNFAQSLAAVAIEADATGIFPPGSTTFYGRYVAGAATDGREPLGTTYAARYATAGGFDGTDLFVWREGNSASGSVSCGSAPSWYPLDTPNTTGAGSIIAFDEQENPVIVTGGPSGFPQDQIFIPNETQKLAVGTDITTGSFNFGWIYLNLQNSASPLSSSSAGQAYVTQRQTAGGRFSGGWDALQLDSACNIGPFTSTPAPTTLVNP